MPSKAYAVYESETLNRIATFVVDEPMQGAGGILADIQRAVKASKGKVFMQITSHEVVSASAALDLLKARGFKPSEQKQTAAQAQAIIDANPKMCYRNLIHLVSEDHLGLVVAARPECGYRCDGMDGPHPINGSPGCFYSGKKED